MNELDFVNRFINWKEINRIAEKYGNSIDNFQNKHVQIIRSEIEENDMFGVIIKMLVNSQYRIVFPKSSSTRQ